MCKLASTRHDLGPDGVRKPAMYENMRGILQRVSTQNAVLPAVVRSRLGGWVHCPFDGGDKAVNAKQVKRSLLVR